MLGHRDGEVVATATRGLDAPVPRAQTSELDETLEDYMRRVLTPGQFNSHGLQVATAAQQQPISAESERVDASRPGRRASPAAAALAAAAVAAGSEAAEERGRRRARGRRGSDWRRVDVRRCVRQRASLWPRAPPQAATAAEHGAADGRGRP